MAERGCLVPGGEGEGCSPALKPMEFAWPELSCETVSVNSFSQGPSVAQSKTVQLAAQQARESRGELSGKE